MKTQVIINGKPVDAVLDDEQVKAALENKKHTGLEHPGYDGIIYNISGCQYTANERKTLKPDEYSDKQICDNWARKQQIERRLYEAAAMLNNEPIDKLNANVELWCISYDLVAEELSICYDEGAVIANVYFESNEAAWQAIEIVGEDDLIWLFRDFQPYIGAYKEEADE